jgi:hypothetical protein
VISLATIGFSGSEGSADAKGANANAAPAASPPNTVILRMFMLISLFMIVLRPDPGSHAPSTAKSKAEDALSVS